MPHAVKPFRALALVGYMAETTAMQFMPGLVTRAVTPAGLRRIWRRHEREVRALTPWSTADLPTFTAPDPTLGSHLAAVAADPMFQSLYSAATWRFADIEIGRLIAFQAHVEIGRYDLDPGPMALATIAQRAAFCLPVAPVEPLSFGVEQDPTGKAIAVTFSSARRTLMFSGFGQDPLGQWQWAILGRPNHVVVCEYGGRYYLRNGYHRLVALLRMGHATATVVVQSVSTWSDVAPPGPGLFPEAAMLAFPRPPMLVDFTDPRLAYNCRMRPAMSVLRVAMSELQIAMM